MTWPPKLPFDKWKNLYREKDGRPRLRRSVVAFMDLLGYRSAVERAHAEGLHEYAAEPAVWSKYHWVARYHNFFCKDCGPTLPLRYRVVDQDAAFEPQRIRKREGSEE